MPPLKTLVLGAIFLLPGALQAETFPGYRNDAWDVSYDPEKEPLRAACVVTAFGPRSTLLINVFDDHMTGLYLRRSEHAMEPNREAVIHFQVDSQGSWPVPSDIRTDVAILGDIDTLLFGQIAAGQELKLDINADGRWDDKFPLDQAYPAMKALADCITEL